MDFLDHDNEAESTVNPTVNAPHNVPYTVLDTVKNDSKNQIKFSHFENFLQGVEKTDRNKVTFYLSQDDIKLLEATAKKYKMASNQSAMRAALAALRDKLGE